MANTFLPLHHTDQCGEETGPPGPYDDSVPCTCYADTAQQDAHGFNMFIAQNFHDCVWSSREVISFAIGMSSIGFWLCAQAPQFYLNCKRQQASALSKCFLLEWLSGDLMNLIGSILTHQFSTQISTAVIFICMDCVLLSQYCYLTKKNARLRAAAGGGSGDGDAAARERRHSGGRTGGGGLASLLDEAFGMGGGGDDGGRAGLLSDDGLVTDRRAGDENDAEAPGASYVAPAVMAADDGVDSPPRVVRVTAAMALTVVSVVSVLSVAVVAALGGEGGGEEEHGASWAAAAPGPRALNYAPPRPATPCNLVACDKTGVAVGTVIAWASALVYLSSRPPQILRNYRRHSVEGLSPIMFMNACLGNLTYGVAVLLRGPAAKVKAAAPFLMGSLGVMAFDFFILGQFWWYNQKRDRKRRVTLGGGGGGIELEPRGNGGGYSRALGDGMSNEKL